MAPHPNGSDSDSESEDDDDTGGGAQPSPPPSPSLQVVDLQVGLGESVVSPPENPTLRALLWNIQDLGGGPSRGPKRPPEVKQRSPFRKSFVPSRRQRRQTEPV